MHIPRRAALALLTAAAFAGSAVTATGAMAHNVLASSIAPSVPTDPVLHEVTPGGAPWVLKMGKIRLTDSGELMVRVRGLIIPALGTPGPVTSIDASLYCGNETTPFATTATSPLSMKGNGMIEANVSLPSTCQVPSVLINPLGITSLYIATSGFGG